MIKKYANITIYTLILIMAGVAAYFLSRPHIEKNAFDPIDLQEQQSGKTVADYFVEHLRMQPEDAQKSAESGASFYVTDKMTINALISNLHYYGLVKDEAALRYALENAEDTHPAQKPNPIKIGKNDIDRGVYGLGASMSAWEIAQILLNYPQEIKMDY